MRNQAFTRQCCACRCHKDKSEFIRLVEVNGEVVIDVDSSIQGRGVYICKDANCIKIAKKKNIINRSLKTANNMDIYDKVTTLIGFAIKSRNIVFGEDQIKTLTKQALVLVDSESSEKYIERVKRFAKTNEVIIVDDLSSLTNRDNVHSIAILDINLANGIKESLKN